MNARTYKNYSSSSSSSSNNNNNINNSTKSNAKNNSPPSSPKSNHNKTYSPRMHPKKTDDMNKLQATHRKQRRPSREESPVSFNRLDKSSSTEQVYAGPTFNNAPVPSALPIPSFSPRGSPIINNNQPQPLYMSSTPSFQQQSAYLMNLLLPQQKQPAYSYELEQNQSISEIQNGLRSMLKIAC